MISVANRLFLSTILIALALISAGKSLAEQRLHERVIDPTQEESPLVEQPAEGHNPAALRLSQMDMEITEPNHSSTLRTGEEPFQNASPPSTAESHQRLRQWQPDLETARTADQVSYHSTFSPSIAPYKRISSLDEVGNDYELRLSPGELREVAVGGNASEDRDLFWGSIIVLFVPNQAIPIPSVAPEARILSVRSRPNVPVRFFRDPADNFYVSSPHRGQVRIIFVTDAPSSYFGGSIPGDVRADQVPEQLRPSLPPEVNQATQQVAQRLGLDPQAPIARNLTRLVAYLRAFENEPLQIRGTRGTDPYLTLAFGQRGVCRHRAFVFVVTVQGLGVPARFITNEVHAFSEVYIPTLGWIRIDLGGEARLAPESEYTVQHRPQSPDPFPWPPGSHPPLEREGRGQGNGQRASNAARSHDDPRRGTDTNPNGSAQENEVGNQLQEESEAPYPAQSQRPERRRLEVRLTKHTGRVIRGESLLLAGTVQSADGAVSGARVTLWLQAPASGRMIRLGSATSLEGGNFQAHLHVPSSVAPGDYTLVARAEDPDDRD